MKIDTGQFIIKLDRTRVGVGVVITHPLSGQTMHIEMAPTEAITISTAILTIGREAEASDRLK